MSISTTYLLNVALHAAILSILASGILLAMRQARHRSAVTIVGLLAVGVLPWLTALRPAESVLARFPEIQTRESAPLPTWTVVTLHSQQEQTPVPPASAVAARFVFPDPVKSLLVVWMVGAVTGVLLLGIAALRVRFWRKSLSLLNDREWRILQALSPEIPARGRFQLSATAASPCVSGFFRPQIVLPGFLFEPGSEIGLRWAMRHEIAHWQAGDSRWMIFFALIRCANWWNPLVHRLVTQWSDAREQLCDLHATDVSDSRADYGRFLVTMAGRITRQPPLAVAMAKRRHARRLRQRIVLLLGVRGDAAKPLGKGFIGILSALFVTGAILASALRIEAEEVKNPANNKADAESAEHRAEPSPAPEPGNALRKPPETQFSAKATAGPQLKFNTKMLITAKKSALKDGALLTDKDVQLYMRSVAQITGTELMTAPSVSAGFGQSVEIQIIHQVPPHPDQKTSKEQASFVGVSLTLVGNLAGNQVDLKFDADYRFVRGLPNSLFSREEVMKMNINPDDIRIVRHTITAKMGPGETAVSDLGGIEPGKFLQILVTALPVGEQGEMVDAFMGGKPVDPPSGPAAGTSPTDRVEARPFTIGDDIAASGKVRLNAVVIDLPRDPELPAGQRHFKKLSPADDDSLNALVKHHGLEKRKLAQVEIPLNRPGVPWPDFPEIRLSAVASKDLAMIALTNDSEKNGTSTVTPMSSGSMVHMDVQSGNPSIERRVYITVDAVK